MWKNKIITIPSICLFIVALFTLCLEIRNVYLFGNVSGDYFTAFVFLILTLILFFILIRSIYSNMEYSKWILVFFAITVSIIISFVNASIFIPKKVPYNEAYKKIVNKASEQGIIKIIKADGSDAIYPSSSKGINSYHWILTVDGEVEEAFLNPYTGEYFFIPKQ
ncbi:hypothetical protein [Anaerovorax odorimutans]|uniref:hypothetical protein n=1 Tax=Anaerovorax odorimutans TaxID=109327 RepID=UPI0003F664C8|nr:hypothetical protein [Anaerovorax odorimutans]